MNDWKPIETAPMDGRRVWVRRIYAGRVIAEGEAVFDFLHEAAPSRIPLGLDPLGRVDIADCDREADATKAWAETKKWLRPDRLHVFPTPTQWRQVLE